MLARGTIDNEMARPEQPRRLLSHESLAMTTTTSALLAALNQSINQPICWPMNLNEWRKEQRATHHRAGGVFCFGGAAVGGRRPSEQCRQQSIHRFIVVAVLVGRQS